ncbi:MAG: ATP-dependent DNA helicase [Deltaproteobacteria bacterium]|nr:ATP-dependent DNA helicase [Deltaproteobacteria bacterium]
MLESKIARFFADRGPLATHLPGFEVRAEQVALARAVSRALCRRAKLVAEAGTGIGKTLSYLAPAVLSGLKVVVSTGTKNLQEQIVGKDLPDLERATGGSIPVQVLKGRTNYLCLYRADRFAQAPLLPSAAEVSSYQEICEWRETTADGDRAELALLRDDSTLWRELSATSEQCLGRKCDSYERCFVTTMRRRAMSVPLVIVNHHLYLADLSLRQRTGDQSLLLLPPHDLVIFDEAHDLDEIASQHFGVQASSRRVEDLCRDVFRATEDAAEVQRLRPAVDAVRAQATALFERLPLTQARTLLVKIGETPLVHEAFTATDQALERLEAELAASRAPEAPALARRAATLAAELSFLLDLPTRPSLVSEIPAALKDDSDHFVRFGELSGRNRSVVARPMEVSTILAALFQSMAAVFLSATLTVQKSFAHFRRRLGLTGLDDVEELALGSPFDYQNNARLYLPNDLCDPDQPDFASLASGRAVALVAAAQGGAFILCTSHRMLPVMRDAVAAQTDLEVLTQGEMPRTLLVERFRKNGDAVLVATMSFWQGVDVPGQALRLVIIDKLPFASPSDPVTAARLELLRARGEDPFSTYQVPQAALLLRQGFGRLIRRKTDRGLVAVLDRRLLSRSYGPVFLQSLPECPRLQTLAEAEAYLRALNDAS